MIRDTQLSNSKPLSDSLSVQPNQEISSIFRFIDFSIGKFHTFYLDCGDSDKEDRISDYLIAFFDDHMHLFNNGYLPIRFSNKPTESTSTRQPDIGVYLKPTKYPLKPILVIEAKRLYDSSHSIEYVSGNTGGIERFKRCKYAANDTICGMIGYIQIHNSEHWFVKINNWIDRLAKENTDETIEWTDKREHLVPVAVFERAKKYSSSNYRKSKDDFIDIFHYFIELL